MENKVALITGAASGIGKAVAELLHIKGYHIWLVDINEKALIDLHKQLSNSTITLCNLSDKQSIENLSGLINKSKKLDLALLNVGVITPGNFLEIPFEKSELQLQLNLWSTLYLNRICGQKMKEQGFGDIVNTVSMAGIVGLKGSAVYSASKFGLRGFLMAFREELKPFNVNVSGIYLSAIDTPMLRAEAIHPNGSPLNFVSEPVKVERVAELVLHVVETKKLEYYLPEGEGFSSRILGVFPSLISKLYGYMEKKGEKGRKKFIEKNNLKT
nr:SDR family oxidoreductase [uncultured Flavobacterium sp.]